MAELRVDRHSDARALFNQLCGGCHALADSGAQGKRFDLDTSALARLDTEAQRRALARRAILHGQPDRHGAGVAMPAWKGVLVREELDALVTYLAAVAGAGG